MIYIANECNSFPDLCAVSGCDMDINIGDVMLIVQENVKCPHKECTNNFYAHALVMVNGALLRLHKCNLAMFSTHEGTPAGS